MSYQIPKFRHPDLPVNDLGYTKAAYEGSISTLCAGCGHDSISGALVRACHELSIEPHKIAKLSGIGCSSKTPTYFLGKSHGFNSVHGRMPSVVTGAAGGVGSVATAILGNLGYDVAAVTGRPETADRKKADQKRPTEKSRPKKADRERPPDMDPARKRGRIEKEREGASE